MRDGFARLRHPASRLGEIDLDASRAHRLWVHEQVRRREHLSRLLDCSAVEGDRFGICIEEA